MTEDKEREARILKMRMGDLAYRADRKGGPVCSDFLTERQCEMLKRFEESLPVSVFYFGGHEGAERRVAVFCPSFLVQKDDDLEKLGLASNIQVLQIRLIGHRFAKRELTHRDYLGALLGSGIERDKIGDIILDENGAWAWIKQEVADYVAHLTTSVAYVRCEVTRADKMPESWQPLVKENVISVSSMRLDSIVGRGFNLSRGDAAYLIRTGKVFINGELMQEPDQKVRLGDSITLRGKGKFKIAEEKGNSRSGRIQLLIRRMGK